MPVYAYRCGANGRVVEVRHGMSEEMRTWGEVCAASGENVGSTPKDASVERAPTLPVIGGSAASDGPEETGGMGGMGGPGGCGLPGCCRL